MSVCLSRSDEYSYEYGYVFLVGISMSLLSCTVTSRDDVIIPIPLFSGTQMLQTSTRSDVLKTSGRELKQYLGWKLNGIDKLTNFRVL